MPATFSKSARSDLAACAVRPAGRRRRRTQRRRGGGDRPLVGAGEHGDAAVGLDAHRHFGADQIEALRAHVAHQQAHAGQADFGFRRARHHGAVGVAHDDVAQAQGRAALLVTLDLGAADHDRMRAAEILLDRRLQPRRRDVEFDRAARQPPPQAEHRHGHQRDGDRRAPEQAAHERPAQEPDHATAKAAPTAAAGPHAPTLMRRVAGARRMVGWMPCARGLCPSCAYILPVHDLVR